MVSSPTINPGVEVSQEEVVELIVSTVQKAIEKINIDCNEAEVRFPPEAALNIARVLDVIFSKAAITIIDGGDGWHSFALSEDGEICKLSRGSNASTFLPNLNPPDENKHFRVFHRSGADHSFESIVNEDLVERAFAAILSELITASEKDDFIAVELKDPVLIADLVKTRRSTFMAIARKLIYTGSKSWSTLSSSSTPKKIHSVALSENGTVFVLSREDNKSSFLTKLGSYGSRLRVFHRAT